MPRKSFAAQNRKLFEIKTDLICVLSDGVPSPLTCQNNAPLPVIRIKMNAVKEPQIKTYKPTHKLC